MKKKKKKKRRRRRKMKMEYLFALAGSRDICVQFFLFYTVEPV
jgi:hypothetical protein